MSLHDRFENIVDGDALEIIFRYFTDPLRIPFLFVNRRWKETAKRIHDKDFPHIACGFQSKTLEKMEMENGKKERVINVDWFINQAAQRGYFDLVTWSRGLGCPLMGKKGNTMKEMAKGGNVEVLKWANEVEGLDLDPLIYCGAAKNGHVHIMQWAWEKKVPFPSLEKWWGDEATPSILAAIGGHLDCLIWMRENGLALHEDCLPESVFKQHFHVADYIVQNKGTKKMQTALYYSHQLNDIESLEWIAKNDMVPLVRIQYINPSKKDLVEWMMNNWDKMDTKGWDSYFARAGNLEVFILAKELGRKFDLNRSFYSACTGDNDNLELLKWFHHQGATVPNQKYQIVYLSYCLGRIGSIRMYEWYQEISLPLNLYRVVSGCISYQKLDFLEFLRKKGAKFGRTYFISDTKSLEHLIKLGLKLRPDLFKRNSKWGDSDVLNALKEKGCKWKTKECFREALRNCNYVGLKWICENCGEEEFEKSFRAIKQV